MIPTITGYYTSDNIVKLRLFNKNVPTNLQSVERVELSCGTGIKVSSDTKKTAFLWRNQQNLGVLAIFPGRLGLIAGIYTCRLLVFDDLNYEGVFWGFFRIRII